MRNVVFVVPYAMESTLRFVRAAANLEGVRLAIVSQEPSARLPKDVKEKLEGHVRCEDVHDASQLEQAVKNAGRELGGDVQALIGILETLQEPLAIVRERMSIRGMDRKEAEGFRDKSRMKDIMRSHDVPCARHALVTNREQAHAFCKESGYPVVAKPPAGAGARNTMRLESPADLDGYLRSIPPRPGAPLLLEEFIRGREHSFDSVSIGGKHLFHSISQYSPTPLEVMQSPWIQWCVLLPRETSGPEYDDIRAAGKLALDSLGMVTGMTHMEWFRRDDGSLAISEVAARPPGAQFTSLISYAHDKDFYKVWAEISIFERFEAPERLYACGAAYLRAQGTGVVSEIAGLEEVERELGELVVDSKLPRVGQAPASSYEGEGYVILRHPETAVVEAGLRKIVETIKIRLA